MIAPRRIIIHHSASSDGGALDWSELRRWHLEQGWLDIGYHAGAEYVHNEPAALYGRPTTMDGAHCRGFNHDSLGFVFVGNFQQQAPDYALLDAAAYRVLVPWCLTYDLGVLDIFGHRDFARTDCPGKMFDLDLLRQVVTFRLRRAREG